MAKSSNSRATIAVEDMANLLQFLQLMLTVTAVTGISFFEPHVMYPIVFKKVDCDCHSNDSRQSNRVQQMV